jgi:hypothetical protein
MSRTDVSTYRRDLIVALRLRDVPGDRIGEIVAEVESHLADTGEDPVDAFGPAREYAAGLTAEHGPRRVWRTVGLALGGLTAGWLLATGIFAVVTGDTVAGLPGWLVLAAGVGISIPEIVVATRSSSDVRDPRTGEQMVPGPDWIAPALLAFQLVLVAVIAVVTVLLR